MFELFWEWRHEREIAERQPAASRPTGDGVALAERVERLEESLDHLALICMAMWGLVEERTDLTDDDLAERIQEIDLRDGTRDGKPAPSPATCRKCGRTMSSRHQRCLYCGHPLSPRTPFDLI